MSCWVCAQGSADQVTEKIAELEESLAISEKSLASAEADLISRDVKCFDLAVALRGVLGVIDARGFMTPEQQEVLWQARKVLGK